MASVKTAIEIYDRVSSPINHMMGAINNMIGAFHSLDSAVSSGFDVGQIHEAEAAIIRAQSEVDELGDYIQQNEQHQDKFNKKVRDGESAVDGLTGNVLGLVGAYASLQGVQKLINLSDEYVQTTARLNMIVDDLNTVEGLQEKIFASAQRSRSSYTDTADMISKLALRTGDLFTNDEAIAFAENLNKLYVIAGASQEEMKSSQLQLTQALGSGVLRGEEFNAVFEAAPNVMQQVADYMDVPLGKLREMSQEGKITGDIVKNALLSIPQEVQDDFDNIPMTWAQVWTGVMNKIYFASRPILEVISWLAQNWSILAPIILGVASALAVYLAVTKGVELATKVWAATQAFFNSVMALNPIFIIIMAVMILIGLIYAVVAAVNKATGSTLSATGIITGALMMAVAFIWNLFLGLVDLVLGVINIFWNRFAAFANFFGNVFNDPIGSIIRLFGDMADSVLGILETIASAIDKIFGSNLAGAVQGWRSSVSGWVDKVALEYGNGTYKEKVSKANLTAEDLGLSRWAYTDAYNKGYAWGEDFGSSVSSVFGGSTSQIPSNISDIAENTGKSADAIDASSEDLKYLRDLAEQETVNRFTTAEIKVEMTNNNSINGNMDLDGIVDYLVVGVNEAMEKAAEGVHV